MKHDHRIMNDDEIQQRLNNLLGWERDSDTIRKLYKVDTYLAGLAFASAVGVIAEGFDHHPDIFIGWRKVTVTLNTHAVGGKITPMDFQVAEAIESLPYKPAPAG